MTLIQPRRQYQVDQGFRTERQDRGADRQGLDAGDRAANRRREAFGAINGRSSDANTVQLGHPDAYVALTNTQHECAQSFFDPAVHLPRTEERAPARMWLLTSPDVMGGAQPGAVLHHDQIRRRQSEIVQAVRDATKEAQDSDPQRHQLAVEIYKEGSRRQDQRRGSADYGSRARHDGMEPAAAGHHEIRRAFVQDRHAEDHAKSLTDYYLPASHDLKGN